jgi:hypothetical protein
MNLDAIKKKLEMMQSKPTSGGANNQTKRFKPQIGKQTVRVVPFQLLNSQNNFVVQMTRKIGDWLRN